MIIGLAQRHGLLFEREGEVGTMGLIKLLELDQMELIFNDSSKVLMIETCSGGAVPKYVTVHVDSIQEIDSITAALQQAKQMIRGGEA